MAYFGRHTESFNASRTIKIPKTETVENYTVRKSRFRSALPGLRIFLLDLDLDSGGPVHGKVTRMCVRFRVVPSPFW